MPPAKHHNRSARAFSKRSIQTFPTMIGSDPKSSQLAPENSLPDNTSVRPAMPSGTVRARRVYPRYRKGKVRSESHLEPAAPNPPVLKQPDVAARHARPGDSKSRHQVNSTLEPSDHLPSTSPPQPTNTSHNHDKIPLQHTKELNSPLHQSAPVSAKHAHNQMEHSQPQLSQQVDTSASSHFQPVVPQHIFPTHQQPGQHVNPHIVQIPTSIQVAHLVPTQQLVHTPAQQGEVSVSQPRTVPVLAPTSSQTSVQSSQSALPSPTSNNPASDHTQATHASQVHAKPLHPNQATSVDNSHQVSNCHKDSQAEPYQASVGEPSHAKPDHHASLQGKEADTLDQDKIARLVSKIKASVDGPRARPLICQDITNSNADTLRISRLPRGVTYDRLLSMVEPFGEVEDLAWSASDPYVCDVTYRDAAAAHEAKHFLGDALVGSDAEPPLKAELRSRDPGAQLFVGDLTPDVTEEMLEAVFSELVGEPVTALLKRDPDSFSPIGYGFLSFKNESSANFALVAGHRIKVGNACVRVGRAERNTYLYVSDLAQSVAMDELKTLFGKFGTLVDEDTVIVRRSYAFIRYKNRGAAEKAKRTLDKTDMKGRLSVRYAEAEPLKACVAVQFHSSVPRPPNSLRDLLIATFSKHGNCSVEIPRLSNGMWRKVAFVTFHGEPIAANMAALEAVQSVRFVSSLPVCCQFARELIPRLPSRGIPFEKAGGPATQKENRVEASDRFMARNFLARRNIARRNLTSGACLSKENTSTQQGVDHPTQHSNGDRVQQTTPDFVPVYVPLSALHHPNQQIQSGGIPSSDCDFSQYHWQNRVIIPNNRAPPHSVNHPSHAAYTSFSGPQERPMRW